MIHDHSMLAQKAARAIRAEMPADVYKIAADLEKEFPGIARETLVGIVTEAVVEARANAVWEKKDA